MGRSQFGGNHEVTFTQHEWLEMFSALNSEQRFNMLIFLNNEGKKTKQELSEKFDLSEHGFRTHINLLRGAKLIDYTDRPEYKHWGITDKGKMVLEILHSSGGKANE